MIEILEISLFTLLALGVMAGGLMILLARRPAIHAMGFLIALLSVAGLFALLHQSFLFFAQVLVSVGGVVIVTLIMILTTNLREEDLPAEPHKTRWLIGAAVVVAPLSLLLYRTLTTLGDAFPPVSDTFPPVSDTFGGTRSLGALLFHNGVLPFEILSVLLLTAMVGAIIIGKKEQSYDRES